MSKPSRPPRAAVALSSVLATALAIGGVLTPATAAQAADLVPVPKTDYRLHAVSSESDPYPAPPSLDGTALGAFDGDFATQWTSRYSANAPFPHWIVVDLQRSLSVKALDYSVKKGQGVAAKTVEVYVTDDADVARNSPADGGWGAASATATLHAPTANDEKQRITLDSAKDGRYVALLVIDAQGTTGEARVRSRSSPTSRCLRSSPNRRRPTPTRPSRSPPAVRQPSCRPSSPASPDTGWAGRASPASAAPRRPGR